MVKMNIEEVSLQTQQIIAFCQKASQAVEQASTATQSFGGVVGLSSEAFTNFKAYISEVYPATAKSITMVAESAQKANEAYKEGYLSEVGSETLDSEELEQEIQQAASLIARKQDSLHSLLSRVAGKEDNHLGVIQAIQGSIFSTEAKQQKLQEKLTKLLSFEGKSTSYFTDVALDLSLLSKAMTALGVDTSGNLGAGAWNGTRFSMADKTWIREINIRWDEKEQLKKLEQQELFDKNVKKLEKYHIYCAEITDQYGVLQKIWTIDKNGKRIWDEELQEFLEKNGHKLPKSMVDIVDWKKLYELELAAHGNGDTYLTKNNFTNFQKGYLQAGSSIETLYYNAYKSGLADIVRFGALGLVASKMATANQASAFGEMSASDAARYAQFWDDVAAGKTVYERLGVVDPISKLKTVGKEPYVFNEYNPDPAKAIYGSGKDSHPIEWNQTINNLKNQGVEVVEKGNGTMGYAPKTELYPPQLNIDSNASYSALMHEQQHYLDDFANGFPGPQYNYQDINRYKFEFNAYMKEIHLAEQAGNKTLANQLYENYILERRSILGY